MILQIQQMVTISVAIYSDHRLVTKNNLMIIPWVLVTGILSFGGNYLLQPEDSAPQPFADPMPN
jgi:hypothetical protein